MLRIPQNGTIIAKYKYVINEGANLLFTILNDLNEREKKMKKKVSLLLVLALVLSMSAFALTACGGGGEVSGDAETAEPVVIHFGSTQGTTHAWYVAAETFAQKIKDESGGSMEVSMEFGGVWGSDKDHAEAVQNGSLDMYIGSTVGADAVVNKIGFVNLPYFINSYQQVDDLIYNGWVGETIKKDMEEAGFVTLGLTDCDFRWISNSVRPINSAADMKGMKIRTPESKMFLSFFTNLGATPTSMAFTELPSALQQGTVEGQDNGPVLSYTNGLHQFNKYWVKSNHSFAAAVVVFNQSKWDSLTAEQQQIIAAAAEEFCLEIRTTIREDVEEMTEAMIAEGCEVIEVSDQLDKDMKEAAAKVWQDTEVTAHYDQDAVDRILKEAGLI